MAANFGALLRTLDGGSVEFILVGGLAAAAHGAARATYDVDVVYRRSPENLARLVDAPTPLHPYLRGAPAGLPFAWRVETLGRGLNFTRTTAEGGVELLGEATYGGTYDALPPDTQMITAFGIRCRCLVLERLIEVKRAAGLPKDLEAIAKLEAIPGGAPTLTRKADLGATRSSRSQAPVRCPRSCARH